MLKAPEITYHFWMTLQHALIIFCWFVQVSALAAGAGKAAPVPNAAVTIERLRALEREIRARADEANEEVLQMEAEAKEIRLDAARKAAKIRDEAEAYTRSIEKEIQEIQKRSPAREKRLPTREELSAELNTLTDPLLTCWQMNGKPDQLERCLVTQFRRAMEPRVGAMFPEYRTSCDFKCAKQ